MTMQIKISNGPISYKYAENYLEKRVKKVKDGKADELLWILEHPTTFTAGVRYTKDEILDKKIIIIQTKRGGKITLHNPGQKIIYFVLNLNYRKKDIRNLVRVIENSIIEFLKNYNIAGKADKNKVGIWVKNNKIAAIGIRVTRWVAYYGCSININNNLNEYKKIIPCGLSNKKITSIFKEKRVKVKEVNKNLKKIFEYNLDKV